MVLVAVQLSVPGLYLPPVFKTPRSAAFRPRRSFRCRSRLPCDRVSRSGRVGGAGGCPTVRAGIVSPAGVQNGRSRHIRPRRSFRCRSRLPCDQTRAAGALVVLVAVQLSVLGLYLPPVLKCDAATVPPQTIISLPVQTAV